MSADPVPTAEPDPPVVSFRSHGVRCEAWWLDATTDALRNDRGRPCVVMGHGFAATRDTGLLPFARRFAEAGCDVLVFDYRGFGTSEVARGHARQDVDHWKHRADYHAAVAHARSRPGVDADRIAVWGSSYSGGHVVVVAAQDPRIAAVISQGAAMDGLKALFGNSTSEGPGKTLRMLAAVGRDVVSVVRRRAPVTVPVVGDVGSGAVISGRSSEHGYLSIAGPSFVNEMCARGLLRVGFNRPVTSAAKVAAPMLIVIADKDDVAPPAAVHEAARRAPNAQTLSFDCKHFDIYVGDVFATSVARQVRFLTETLAP